MADWDELRRRVRRLENDIELKLVSFSKLATSYQANVGKDDAAADSDTAGMPTDTAGLYQVASSMSVEVEQLLHQLSAANEDMSAQVASGSATATAAHTAAHHRGRFRDFSDDFQKTRERIAHAHNQAELFVDMRDRDHHEDMARMDALLRERGSLHNADEGANSFLRTGTAVKESLSHQVNLLRGGMTGLGSVRGGFASIGDVVTLVQKKRSRDCYILTFFISFLICFLLYWGWMR
mmetsp:Transcript_373/g.1294  ORF Transcript_373/g.1294 Transcript_373/m.1294 type:complete len:237 (+) Transcript_373:661-1371(+)